MAFWRDCQAWKDEKLPMSTASDDAAKAFDSALTQIFTREEDITTGGVQGACQRMLQADPDFVMGQVLSVGMEVLSAKKSIRSDPNLSARVASLSNLASRTTTNDRERLHCRAIDEWANGRCDRACETWEEIMFLYPSDLLALKMSYICYLVLGNHRMLRDSVGRVILNWDRKSKFYGYLKSMHAFGLQETNLFPLAEAAAKGALELHPDDVWAVHTMGHCYEMTGRRQEGATFMLSTEKDWTRPGRPLVCHNFWHWSLFHLEMGNHDQVLEIYDQQISSRCQRDGGVLDIADAASLLQRLEFVGVDVGSRWHDVVEVSRTYTEAYHQTFFADFNLLVAFLGHSDLTLADSFFASADQFCAKGYDCLYRDLYEEFGRAVMKGLLAFKQGDYGNAADLLLPVMDEFPRIGGSHAQSDLFTLFLIVACIRSHSYRHNRIARALIDERRAIRGDSPFTERLNNILICNHEQRSDT